MVGKRESILQSQALLVGAQFARLGLGLLITVLLARGLDDGGWAAFTLLATACAFAAQLVDAGLQPALVAELAAGARRAGTLFKRVLGLRLGAALLLIMVALARPELLPERRPAVLFALVLLVLPFRTWNAIFAASRRNRVTALGGLVVHALFLVAVVLIVAGLATERRLAAVLAALCLREIALSLYPFLRALAERRAPTAGSARTAPRGLFLLSAATICGAAYLHVDVFMLQSLRGPEAVGDYGLALRLLMPVIVGANLLAAPFLPFLARRHDERSLPALGDALVLGALVLGAVLPASVCFAAPEALIGFLRGRGSLPAAAALGALAPVPVAVAFGSVFSLALVVGRRYGSWLLVTAIGLALNLGLNARWIPEEGARGAARATLVTECAVALLAALALLLAPPGERRWSPRLVAIVLVAALAPALPALGLHLALGEIRSGAELALLVGLALAASLIWVLFGPGRGIRARLEGEEGAP